MKTFKAICETCLLEFTYTRSKVRRFCGGKCSRSRIRPEQIEARFWPRVEKLGVDECWNWKAGKDWDGYGLFFNNGKLEKAHRYSWRLKNGDIPDGMQILHKCDNPSCVNPSHLFSGTGADNMADKMAKGRHKLGSQTAKSKLTEEKVLEIRKLKECGGVSVRELALKYEVDPSTIMSAVKRVTWRHV